MLHPQSFGNQSHKSYKSKHMCAGGNRAALPPLFAAEGETEAETKQTHPQLQEESVSEAG